MELCGIEQSSFEGYVYRGEGNANLVIALPSTISVLRFRKIRSVNHDGRKQVEFERQFFIQIISKYLNYFVKEPEFVYCHPQHLPDWNQLVENHRPGYRCHQNSYDEYATKLPDYTLLPIHLEGKQNKNNKRPTLCIEIKPKQGFVPLDDRQNQRCPYCIKQFYKVTMKTISRRSHYCPCDLFSGDRSRLRRAIHALVESPQNNFIVFKNGFRAWGEGNERGELEQLLYQWFSADSSSDTVRCFEYLNYLISEAILREFPVYEDQPSLMVDIIKKNKEITAVYADDHQNEAEIYQEIIQEGKVNLSTDEICQFPEGNLPRGSVLERIFRMQQLHRTSFEVVYEIYSKHSKTLNDQMVYFPSSTEDIKQSKLNFEEIELLRNYFIFCTARDCSILLALHELDLESAANIPPSHIIWLPQRKRCFSFNIGITDVDPKTIQRIEKQKQQNICALDSMLQISKENSSI